MHPVYVFFQFNSSQNFIMNYTFCLIKNNFLWHGMNERHKLSYQETFTLGMPVPCSDVHGNMLDARECIPFI